MNELTELSDIKAHIHYYKTSLLFVKMAQCGVCDAVFEKTKELLAKYPQVESIVVSIEQTPTIAGDFLVFTAPTILLFIEGKEIFRQSRFVMFGELENALRFSIESI